MPPTHIKTIQELILWEYAKLIAGSATGNRKDYRFAMHTFKKLQQKEMKMADILNYNKMLVQSKKSCAYCGSTIKLHWEHIIPKSKGGPENIDNMVLSCANCNLKKGAKDPFNWYKSSYNIPTLVLGKLLKLCYLQHEHMGTLNKVPNEKLNVRKLALIFIKKIVEAE